MNEAWSELEARLGRRRDRGRALRVWWRDDDARRPSAALDRLLALAERHAMPLALAVVPDGLDAALPARLDASPGAATLVLQHGYAHRNRARPGERAVECGGACETGEILAELEAGRRQLAARFASRFRPVLVPPWNRIEARVAAALPAAGYCALSAFGEAHGTTGGLARADAHLDVLRWRGGARFAGEGKLLAETTLWLDRADVDSGETVFGLLTHHLDHDDATWVFLERFLALLARAAEPVSVDAVFDLEAPNG